MLATPAAAACREDLHPRHVDAEDEQRAVHATALAAMKRVADSRLAAALATAHESSTVEPARELLRPC